jgi:hypothetical protein
VREVDLPLATDDDGVRAAAIRGAALRLDTAGLAEGDTIRVELHAADPAAPLETLTFTYGVDSAIGFRAAVEEALEGAAVAVVTSSPRSMTVDLKAVDARAHAFGERLGAAADRMGRMAERFGDSRRPLGRRDRWRPACGGAADPRVRRPSPREQEPRKERARRDRLRRAHRLVGRAGGRRSGAQPALGAARVAGRLQGAPAAGRGPQARRRT